MSGGSVKTTGGGGFRPTIDDLVGVARTAGRPTTSRRTIHHWRKLDRISKGDRLGASYRYPLASIGEVESIVHWAPRRMPADLRVFARYIEAGTRGSRDPVLACISVLELLRADFEDARRRAASDEDAVRREARRAARARGEAAILPRRVRGVTAEHRDAAFYFVYATLMQVQADPDELAEGEFQLERLIGHRSGRGGSHRDISDLAIPTEDWAVNIDDLITSVRAASPPAIELARTFVELNCVWLPALLPALTRDAAPREVPLVDVMLEAAERLVPEVYVALFATRLDRWISRLSDEKVRQLLLELQPAAGIAEMLAEFPASDRNAVRERLRPYQRVQLLRHDADSVRARDTRSTR